MFKWSALFTTLFVVIAITVPVGADQCEGIRIRRSWAALSSAEKELFLEALEMAYDIGLIKIFAEIHWQNFAPYHNSEAPLFFPWHRYYIYRFESFIRQMHPKFRCVTLPYWPWESSSSLGTEYIFKPEYYGYRAVGCALPDRFSNWWQPQEQFKLPTPKCINRTWPETVSTCGEACTINILTNNVGFAEFFVRYEDMAHKAAHKLMGGIVDGPASPYDPAFWLLHTNIDRHWTIWQDCHDHDIGDVDHLTVEQFKPNVFQNLYEGPDTCMEYFHNEKENEYFPMKCVTAAMTHRIQKNEKIPMEYAYDDSTEFLGLMDATYGRCHWDWFWDRSRTRSNSYNEAALNRKGNDINSHKNATSKKRSLLLEGDAWDRNQTLMVGEQAVEIQSKLSPDGKSITIKVSIQSSKPIWVGIGWGGSDNMMLQADMVIASTKNGQWFVGDYFSREYDMPQLDASQDIYDTSAGYDNGRSWMIFSRKLVTDDTENDRPIPQGHFQLAIAYGTSDVLSFHRHAAHPKVVLVPSSDAATDDAADDDEADESVSQTPVDITQNIVYLDREYYNRMYGPCLPLEQLNYKQENGKFSNFLVQHAREQIDAFFDKLKASGNPIDYKQFYYDFHEYPRFTPIRENPNGPHKGYNPRLPDDLNELRAKVHLYHIAECFVENVDGYGGEQSNMYAPPCKTQHLPFTLSISYHPCGSVRQ